jgi:hypothetical protein
MVELARVQRRPAIAAQDCAVEDDCRRGSVTVVAVFETPKQESGYGT